MSTVSYDFTLSFSYELFAVVAYLMALVLVGTLSYRKQKSAEDFIIGDRSLNPWLTALSAHASDMSSWLFIGYPAAIYTSGISGSWAGIGLLIFMFLNWQIVAPKIRVATEQYKSLTFSSFFENRLVDKSGTIRISSSLMALLFYTCYIAAGLVGMGRLIENLFHVNYEIGVIIGILIVIPYVFIGGYTTLAWIDLFQGFFLLSVILFVPIYILPKVGFFNGIIEAAQHKKISSALLPNLYPSTIWATLLGICGWGLGYFGQPHIVTKFMGISKVSQIRQSKYIGMSWMLLALGGATLVGLVAIPYFQAKSIDNPEMIFSTMVNDLFHPFLVGLILCAVIAATINAVSSQVLVLTSSLTEDLYKRIIRPGAPSKELLFVSRMGVVVAGLIAYGIAAPNSQSVYGLTQFAWSGLGSAFGPVMLCCLYSKWVNRQGARAGILVGGLTSALWPVADRWLLNNPTIPMKTSIPELIPGFLLGLTVTYLVSRLADSRVIVKKDA